MVASIFRPTSWLCVRYPVLSESVLHNRCFGLNVEFRSLSPLVGRYSQIPFDTAPYGLLPMVDSRQSLLRHPGLCLVADSEDYELHQFDTGPDGLHTEFH